jgi:hypothetical protein
MAMIEILSPVARTAGKNSFHPAKRLQNLSGKKIGLYDNGKPGGDVVQRRLVERLSARFESLQFPRYTGSIGGRATLTAEGAQAIAKESSAVIGIRGD